MSPTVLRKHNYRFFFFSREEIRKHIHVVSPEGEAKFWIESEVELCKQIGFNQKQINELTSIIKTNKNEIIAKWNYHFGL